MNLSAAKPVQASSVALTFDDAAVGPDREIAARSVLEQVLVFVDGAGLRHTL